MLKSKEEVFELLKQLGNTREEIVEKLRSLGIKGEMRSCSRCPIARYFLHSKACDAVSVAGGHDSLLIGLVDLRTSEVGRYKFRYDSHPSIREVFDFINAFDRGYYPWLNVNA